MTLQSSRSAATDASERVFDKRGGGVDQSLMDDFIAVAHGTGSYDSYKVISTEARDIVSRLGPKGSPQVRLFLRGALARAAAATAVSDRFKELPPRVAAEQARHLARIVANVDDSAEWLDPDHDLFQKELGLATLRLYAAGAQLIDVRCGVPRSLVLKQKMGTGVKTLFDILRLGGFRPYFQIHTHKFNLDQFNEQGWEQCYLCCAELYALHPTALGMFGSSWFYDPALDAISPRLSYLRHTPLQGGARIFFMEQGGDAINNSLSTSPTRRQLYEAGTYMPKNYLLLWGRRQQMAWAHAFINAQPA